MSRTLELSTEVPASLFAHVGAIQMVTDDPDYATCPEISIPGQYQAAFDPLFADEKYFKGEAPDFFGRPDEGIAHLDYWPAAEAAAMLRRAIARLPESSEPGGSFWNASPGNVKLMLERILRITEYAAGHDPSAYWYLKSY